MTQRRVIFGLDPTPTGGNALWWSVAFACRLDAILFVVLGRCARRVGQLRPSPSAVDESDRRARVTVMDALLLAVGEPPLGLEIRIAPVCDPVRAEVARLADRRTDVAVLAGVPRQWRSPAELFVATDPLSPPVRIRVPGNGRQRAQVSRFLLR
jgi:hypothetical protein